ncbi:MAG: sugar phosphate isomerase/epimerase [Phycisphaerales bacterium]|nr:sugar phosphate isomerase/epimerase [Phycisphaerales bacterium]
MNPDRRQVLAATAGTIAAASLSPWLRAQDATPTMKLGLVTYLWGQDLDLPTLLATCRSGGLGGVELRTTHSHGVEPSLDATQRREVKARVADSGVELVGIGSDERFCWPDPKRLEQAHARTIEFLQLSHDTGGSGVKVKPDSFREGVTRARTIEQIGTSLKALGPRAADLGQEIRLEVHGSCASPSVIRDIMTVADHPSVVVCWNCNDTDLGSDGIEANFRLLRPRFGQTVHVRHLSRHAYPYADLFRLLHDTKWHGWMLLEARGELPAERAEAFREQVGLFQEHQRHAAMPREKTP